MKRIKYNYDAICCEPELPKGHSGHRDYAIQYGENMKMDRSSETSLSRKSGREQGLIERKEL